MEYAHPFGSSGFAMRSISEQTLVRDLEMRERRHLMRETTWNQRAMWTRVCLGVVVVLGFVVSTWADIVSGRVFGPDGKVLLNETFTAENGGTKVNFATDKLGNFSVYLEPGTYTVHRNADNTVEGVIHGYPQSATEDIHLKKR